MYNIDPRLLVTLVVLIGGGLLLFVDGPLVSQVSGLITAAMGSVLGYWFHSAASSAERQAAPSGPVVAAVVPAAAIAVVAAQPLPPAADPPAVILLPPPGGPDASLR